MAKKTTRKESTSVAAADQKDIPSEALPEICKLKHDVIDKEFQNIKKDEERRHEELKTMIESIKDTIKEDVKESHSNLKDKIVLTEKTIGDKIDSLSEFDDTLKGNGTPGVWESIRSLSKSMKILSSVMVIIVIFELGGSWSRINWDTLRDLIWGEQEAKQVEPTKGEVVVEVVEEVEEVKTIPEENIDGIEGE